MRKYLLLFLLIFVFTFSSCKKKGGEEEPPKEKTEDEIIAELLVDPDGAEVLRVYFNYMDGSNYLDHMVEVRIGYRVLSPETPTKEGYTFAGWYVDKNYSALYQFSDVVVESMMLYAKWDKYEGVDYSFLLDEYLPDNISSSIELPKKVEREELSTLRLSWSSSDPNTLSNTGVYNPGRSDIEVEMTLTIYEGAVSTSYKKKVNVEKVAFGPLRENKAMFGYYSYWNYNGYTEDQLKLDVINASFAYVNDDFSINMRSISPYLSGLLSAREKGVRVVLSVQGAMDSSYNFSQAAKTEATRKTFVDNLIEVLNEYHFDGVDIDWEYPGWFYKENKACEAGNFTLLMKEIYERVKAIDSDLLVTAALPGGSEGYQRYNLGDVSEYLDFIHLMTYDLDASTKTYHHTALYGNLGRGTATMASVNDSIEIYRLRGVPASKLVIGIAFYGKYTQPETSTNGGLGSNTVVSSYKTITYTNIYANYITKIDGVNIIRYWDDVCFAPYIYDKKNNIFITYDDEESIDYKCKYARGARVGTHDALDAPLGGVMIWEIGEDNTGRLMKAVLSGMKRNN